MTVTVTVTVTVTGTDPDLDPDQAWFWTPAWQAGEREADAQVAAGDLRVYDDMDELFTEARDEVGPG